VDNGALFVAEVAEQRGSCRTETKHCVFHHGLARTDRGEEIAEVIVAVAVSSPRYVFLVPQLGRSHRVLAGILLVVLFRDFLLHRIGEASDKKAGPLLQGCPAYDHTVAGYLHRAFGTGKNEPFVFLATIHEVHPQAQIEAFRIIKETEHHVGYVAAIFPETQSASGHGTRGPMRPGNEMGSAKQVDKKVAGYPTAVSLPLAPLEEMFAVKGNFGRSAQKARPVAGLG
jgi:hypothetical protein